MQQAGQAVLPGFWLTQVTQPLSNVPHMPLDQLLGCREGAQVRQAGQAILPGLWLKQLTQTPQGLAPNGRFRVA